MKDTNQKDDPASKAGSVSRRGFLKGSCCTAAGLLAVSTAGCGNENNSAGTVVDSSWDAEEAWGRDARAEIFGNLNPQANSFQTYDIVYTAGEQGLPEGATLAVVVEHGADWGIGGSISRNKFGGVRLQTSADVRFEIIRPSLTTSVNAIQIVLKQGGLPPRDQLVITLGDPESDGGMLKVPSIAHEATIRIMHNLYGERDGKGFLLFWELPPRRAVRISAHQAAELNAIAKSHALTGEPVSLLVRAEDALGNIAPDFADEFDVLDDQTGQWLGRFAMTPEDGGWTYPDDIRIDRTGVVRLRIESRTGRFTAYSDPIEVTDDPRHEAVIWGQMHGHSLVSDGLGTAEEYYDYARYKSNLDFCALTDHGYLVEGVIHPMFFRHYISEEAWGPYATVTRSKNDPGRFVTLLAYEWTSQLFSDKNVYFFNDDEPWEPYPRTQDELYRRYRGRPVMIISHMMWAIPFMRATDWSNFDPSLERLVEISSVHGTREYPYNPYLPEDTWTKRFGFLMSGHLVTDALKRGHRLGIMCGADTHTGCPGNSICGIQPCRVNGLMAMRSDRITREAVWTRCFDRRVYGTTGPRILLDFELDGFPMGSQVPGGDSGPRQFQVTAYAKLGIEKIELVGADPDSPVEMLQFDPPIWNPGSVVLTDWAPPPGPAYYYVRVTQEDGNMAWSSPIWVG